MKKQGRLLPILFTVVAIVIFSSCGRKNPVPELHLVPGTALLHIHMEPGLSSSLATTAGEFFNGFVLADSLLKKGPIGITLVGIDISTLEPQLLLLTQNVTTEYLTALSARILDLDPRQEEDRVDLISEHGYARASVTQRDGWAAVYIGPAPHITLSNWLEMKEENSLAADTSLAKVIPEEQHITILLPGNLFGFVSFLPLERQIPWWTNYKELAETVKPAALSIFLSWPEPDTGEPVQTGMILARRGGGVSQLEISISDSHIDTDSCLVLLLDLAGGSIFNE